ncbi:cell division protein ZapA [bacterium]|nr:cell division protein ZapA [bacterium]MBU0899483.1 cell division protein ZapA [bacterium]MBU1153937.1 cell division protein ZapA [bacterium]
MSQFRTEVEIFGNVYTIKGDEDPEYISMLAQYVDEKMRNITQKTSTISTTKIAILVALNVTDELFKTKRQVEEKSKSLIDKIKDNL